MPNEYIVYDSPFDVNRWRLTIGVCGSRELFDDQILKDIEATMEHIIEERKERGLRPSEVLIITGGAKGVDTLAKLAALKLGIDTLVIKPNYKENPTTAPLRRNDRIVELSDILIAVPSDKSKGTWYTISKFKRRKPHNQLIILRYDKQPRKYDVEIGYFLGSRKEVENFIAEEWLREVERDLPKYKAPVVIVNNDIAVLRLRDFKNLVNDVLKEVEE